MAFAIFDHVRSVITRDHGKGYGKVAGGQPGPPTSVPARWRLMGGFSVAALLMLLWFAIGVPHPPSTINKHELSGSTYLHTLLAAPDTEISMCRTMLSAEVLKYPCATLPNTRAQGDHPVHRLGGHRKNKLIGIMEYLQQGRPTLKEGDLAMVVDGHDVLFHLPPQALFERYEGILEASNNQLRARLGPDSVNSGIVRNSIVISSPPCSSPAGDTQTAVAQDPFLPGVIIGPHTHMRRLFEKLNSDRATNQEQNLRLGCVFSELLAAQEANRKTMTWWLYSIIPRLALWFSHRFGGEPSPSDLPGNDAEYGLTLDTDSLLIATPEALEHKRCEELKGLQTTEYGSRSPHCTFLDNVIPPFWTLDGVLEQNNTSWLNMDLPYSLKEKTFPVMTQNTISAKPDDTTKISGKDQWESMWFHPHGRVLLDTHVMEATLPLARIDTKRGEWSYWPRWAERAGARSADGVWMEWERFCEGDIGEMLFRDGKGNWVDPRGGWTGGS